MQNNMKTSERPTSLSGKTVSTCLPVDSRASRSLAGKWRGTEDDRYLWPAMLDVIRTVRPRWVVGENVYGIVNWSEGLVFEQVCADLEAAGYEVQPYIIPACGVGAPHRRDRCWFVAHRTDAGAEAMREREDGFYAVEPVAHPDGDRRRKRPNEQKPLPECVGTSDAGNGVENGIVAYSDRQRCEECNASCQSGHTQRTTQNSDAKRRIPDWNGFPTQPPVCGGDDGFPGNWLVSPFLGGAGKPSKPAETP